MCRFKKQKYVNKGMNLKTKSQHLDKSTREETREGPAGEKDFLPHPGCRGESIGTAAGLNEKSKAGTLFGARESYAMKEG